MHSPFFYFSHWLLFILLTQAGAKLVCKVIFIIGAWLGDILFFTFGYIAYVFPFTAAFAGWFMFQQRKRISEFDYLTIGLRILGLLLALVGAAGIASLNFNDLFYFSAGGMLGDVISASLIPYLNFAGTVLI